MKIKYVIKECTPEDLKKYKSKIFRKRRKNIEFQIGEKVQLFPDNIQYITEHQKNATEWRLRYEIRGKGGSNEEAELYWNKPQIVTIRSIGKNEIKADELTYWYRKSLFEKYQENTDTYEDKISDQE